MERLRKELAQKEAMMARLETERGVAGLRAELDAALAVRPRITSSLLDLLDSSLWIVVHYRLRCSD